MFPDGITQTGTASAPLNINLLDSGESFFTVDHIAFTPPNDGAYFFGGNTLRINPANSSDGIFRETDGGSNFVTLNNDLIFASDAQIRTVPVSGGPRSLTLAGNVQIDDGVQLILNPGSQNVSNIFSGGITGGGSMRIAGSSEDINQFLTENTAWSGGITVIDNTRGENRIGADTALGTGLIHYETRSGMEFLSADGGAYTLANDWSIRTESPGGRSNTIEFQDDLTLAGEVRLNSENTNNTTTWVLNGTTTFDGSIVDEGSDPEKRDFLLTQGNGTAIITGTGTHTYEGATEVGSTGHSVTLVVNGDITSSSGVTVADGGTLRGTGTTPGITVQGGGIIRPGNSTGTLTSAGDVSFEQFSLFEIDLGAAAGESSLLDAGGFDFILGDDVTLNLLGTPVGGEYTIAMFQDGGLTGMFSSLQLNGSEQDWSDAGLDIIYGDTSITVVPEPGAYALIGGLFALGGVLFLRRRRNG